MRKRHREFRPSGPRVARGATLAEAVTDDPSVALAALAEAKRALRQAILARRDALDTGWRRGASPVIFERLAALPPVRAARRLLAYHSFGSEPETPLFLERVLAGGGRLLLPRIVRATRTLALHEVRDLDADLIPGPWGIREPDPVRCPGIDPAEVDLILVPGVAFDHGGGRLGYGGGYYDRLLAAARRETPLVAAAFEAQVVDHVPAGPRDRSVDVLVTEAGVYGSWPRSSGPR